MVHGEEGHQLLKMIGYKFLPSVTRLLLCKFKMGGLGTVDLTEAFREDGEAV